MPRESADDKIRKMISEAIAGERQAAEDASDPNIGKLRRIVREELSGVLGTMLNDRGDAPGRRRPARRGEEDDDEGGNILTDLFGG